MGIPAARKPDAEPVEIDREHRFRARLREHGRAVAGAAARVEDAGAGGIRRRKPVEGLVRHEEVVTDSRPDRLVERPQARSDFAQSVANARLPVAESRHEMPASR